MLKELLGSLRAVPIDLVFCAGDMLHFKCSSSLTQGKVRKVRARLPEGQMFGARIEVLAQDEKSRLYKGRLLEPLAAIAHLRGLLPLPFEDRRVSPRIERTVRVLSPQLEGFSALTRDISLQGLCLVVSQVLSVGARMQVEMDLDASSPHPVRFDLETRWSAPDLLTGKNLVGGCFLTMNQRQRTVLKNYLASTLTQ
ncbi:MAG: PilZ domain-containing protein [Candidatus Eremiobacteraeota bacterium]|nr:PilZ domain-containing protein [Candidatus Eremiobacteraeota bacterium]MCW5869140.1 PilZ domain-containing protein [Candidatus Eremiobacteraeota bacterium]